MADKNLPVCTLCTHTPICKNQPQQSCPYFLLKEEKKPAQPKQDAQPSKPQPSSWRKTLRMLWLGFLWVAVLISIVAAFIAGRYSTRPEFVSMVPSIPAPVPAKLPPDEVIHRFFLAILSNDQETMKTFLHPEVAESYGRVITASALQEFATMREIKVLDITPEESAYAVISLTTKTKKETRTVLLKKYQDEWRVVRFVN